MGLLFNEDDHQKEQIEGYQEQMQAIEEKLEKLGNVDTPEVNAQREQMVQEYSEINIRLEGVLQEREQANDQNNDLDFFHD